MKLTPREYYQPGEPCGCGDYPGGACDGCNKPKESTPATPPPRGNIDAGAQATGGSAGTNCPFCSAKKGEKHDPMCGLATSGTLSTGEISAKLNNFAERTKDVEAGYVSLVLELAARIEALSAEQWQAHAAVEGVANLRIKLAAATERLAKYEALLRKAEWCAQAGVCSVCGCVNHAADCELRAALDVLWEPK